jgi:pimeloyl-ACP methyl ester carboxylesterase
VSVPPTSRPLYLGEGSGAVFGVLHEPAATNASALAVLICPPFGWDDICSYRSRRDWATQLAAAGHPTLRIDLPGSGDSAGSPRDPGRLAAWSGAVALASERLRAIPGCERVAAIGVGMGGLAIGMAIAADAPIDEIVLWATPARGRALVRELRAFSRLESAAFDEPAAEEASPLPAGYAGVGGFVLSAETVRDLEALDLAAETAPRGRVTRALLLERDGIAVDARLRDHLTEMGVSVTTAPGPGFGAMMAKPHVARSPTEVFARVRSWLEQSPADAAVTTPPRGSATGAVEAGGGAEETGTSADGPLDGPSLDLDVAGVTVRETPLRFQRPFGDLFAILAEPPPARANSGGVCVVMLNAGAIRRIGPNRMWVEIARRWAARGVPTLRLDLEGIGDADGDGERFSELAELYVPELVAQVRAALDALEARGGCRRFVLCGLCSGAYWAFQGALLDERVTAAFLLNPKALFWSPALEIARDFRRGMLRPSSWRSVMRGEVPLERIGTFVRQAPFVLPRRGLARRSARAERERIPRALDRLRDGDKLIRLLFSGNEALHEELELDGVLGELDRWPNLAVEPIPGNVHTLRPLRSQRAAHEALDRALDMELERAAR